MDYILIQSKDSKVESLNTKMRLLGVDLEGFTGSPILIPIQLLKFMFARGKPIGVVYRYLNGYPSLCKDLIRFLSETFTLVLCKLLNIRLIWICHNVDRESLVYNKRITKL